MAIFRKRSHPMQAGKKKQDMRMAELLHSGEGLKGVYENMVTANSQRRPTVPASLLLINAPGLK